jgi:hypothetical protein
MKRLKAGVVNTLSFVKLSSFTVNSFDVTLDKVVGNGSLTITNLTDLNGLDSCKDFIQINIDLINNDLEGGEYELTITNQGSSYKYLTEVQDYTTTQTGSGIYGSTVRFVDLPITPPTPSFTGLLDTYSGAAAAYSLRQLSGSYSGDAIVVTTNGTNSQSIGFVDNELDTASLEAFANGGNAYISQMYDQSGNGVDLFRSVFSDMPQIVSSGTTITDTLTGKPTFTFPTVNTTLHTSGLAELSLSADWTISFVTKVPLSQTYGLVIGDAIGDAQDSFFIFGGQFRAKLDGVNYGVYGSENRGVTRLWTHSRDTSNTININKDGASYGSVSSAVGAFDFVQIGSNLEINPPENFSELIIWGAEKSASDISGIETNINNFYSIY